MKSRNEVVEMVAYYALANKPTIANSWELARACDLRNIPGVLVECGVFAGAQSAAMALAAPSRIVHMFDSFEGIPEGGEHDPEQPGIPGPLINGQGRLVSSGISVCPIEHVYSNMIHWGIEPERIRLHKGWFQHTVHQWGDEKIALLRLDGDLYESTKVCLEALYPHLAVGGFLIIDDYALAGCRKAVDEYFGDDKPNFTVVEGGSGPVWCERSK